MVASTPHPGGHGSYPAPPMAMLGHQISKIGVSPFDDELMGAEEESKLSFVVSSRPP